MSSTISCPSCQRTLRVPESLLGQAVKCPTCSHNFTAPDSGEEAPSRPAPVSERPSRRPATPPPEDDYEEEPRPSKRRPRDDDDDDAPRSRRRRRDDKPGKVQGVAIMVLIGGILALIYGLTGLGFGAISCVGLLWPGIYYSLVLGVMGLIKGIQLMGDKAYKESPPQGIGIMMIINCINCDVINLVLGILVLVFLSDEEVKDYFR